MHAYFLLLFHYMDKAFQSSGHWNEHVPVNIQLDPTKLQKYCCYPKNCKCFLMYMQHDKFIKDFYIDYLQWHIDCTSSLWLYKCILLQHQAQVHQTVLQLNLRYLLPVLLLSVLRWILIWNAELNIVEWTTTT